MSTFPASAEVHNQAPDTLQTGQISRRYPRS